MNTNSPAEQAAAIAIFFPRPQEEETAVRIARLLAEVAPDSVSELRPETTLSQIFRWSEFRNPDPCRFVIDLEQVLGFELDEFIDDFDFMTFRELVEHAVGRWNSFTDGRG